MKIRIYYEDTDAGAIVYHTNYIKYCERARSEIFFERGLIPSDNDNGGFVVRDIKANFLSMAMLGDILDVTTHILTLKNTSLILRQDIYKEGIKIFSMEILLVYIDIKRAKPSRIPKIFKDIFLSLE